MKKILILNFTIFIMLFGCKTNFKKKEIEVLNKAFNYKLSSEEENKSEKIIDQYKELKSKLNKKEMEIISDIKLTNAEHYFYKGNFKEVEGLLKKFKGLDFSSEVTYINGVFNKKLLEELNKEGFPFPYSLLVNEKEINKLYVYDLINKEYIEVLKIDILIEDVEDVQICVCQRDNRNFYDIFAYVLIRNIKDYYENHPLGEYNRRIQFDTTYLKSDLYSIAYNTKRKEFRKLFYNIKNLEGIYTIFKVGNYPFMLNSFLINFIDVETKKLIKESEENSSFVFIPNDEFMPHRDYFINYIVLQNSINICKKNIQRLENIFLNLQSHYIKIINRLDLSTIPKSSNGDFDVNLVSQKGEMLNRILNIRFKNETKAIIASLLTLFSKPQEDTINQLKEKLESVIKVFPNESFLFLNDYRKLLDILEEIKTDFYLY